MKKSHKYGIEVPRSLQNAHYLDNNNGYNFWGYTIANETNNMMMVFDISGEVENDSKALKWLEVHLIFDVKMYLTRKARLVADGHKTPGPEGGNY